MFVCWNMEQKFTLEEQAATFYTREPSAYALSTNDIGVTGVAYKLLRPLPAATAHFRNVRPGTDQIGVDLT